MSISVAAAPPGGERAERVNGKRWWRKRSGGAVLNVCLEVSYVKTSQYNPRRRMTMRNRRFAVLKVLAAGLAL
jgi:hypothetical protein